MTPEPREPLGETYTAIPWRTERWASVAAEAKRCNLLARCMEYSHVSSVKYDGSRNAPRIFDPIDQSRGA